MGHKVYFMVNFDYHSQTFTMWRIKRDKVENGKHRQWKKVSLKCRGYINFHYEQGDLTCCVCGEIQPTRWLCGWNVTLFITPIYCACDSCRADCHCTHDADDTYFFFVCCSNSLLIMKWLYFQRRAAELWVICTFVVGVCFGQNTKCEPWATLTTKYSEEKVQLIWYQSKRAPPLSDKCHSCNSNTLSSRT